jgi:Aspartyl protease
VVFGGEIINQLIYTVKMATLQVCDTTDDAALAQSLQLLADLEFLQLQHAVKAALDRGRRSAVPRSIVVPSPYDASRSQPVSVPVSEGRAIEYRRTSEAACGSQPSRNRTSHSSRAKRSNPTPSLAGALTDGSNNDKSLVYVTCEINNRLVEMMVDTGAQTSVISDGLMRKLKLGKMLNTWYNGVASGVGTARILGRIERCPVQIGSVEFLLYFCVLETPDDLLLLGIDQMRRFKCQVDLEDNKLVFGGKGGVEVDLLSSSG